MMSAPLSKIEMPPSLVMWARIQKLKDDPNATVAQRALADLCRDYWYPLHNFARQWADGGRDAEDLTQAFFEYVIEKNLFASAEHDKGRLRTFLLTAFKRFVRDLKAKDRAEKRGGGAATLSFDADEESVDFAPEPAARESETSFDRDWGLAILHNALRSVAGDESRSGREAQFELLKHFLPGGDDDVRDYGLVASKLDIKEDAVRKAVQRLRAKWAQIISSQIRATLPGLDTEERVDEELEILMAAVGEFSVEDVDC